MTNPRRFSTSLFSRVELAPSGFVCCCGLFVASCPNGSLGGFVHICACVGLASVDARCKTVRALRFSYGI